jgi:hypothetical protein
MNDDNQPRPDDDPDINFEWPERRTGLLRSALPELRPEEADIGQPGTGDDNPPTGTTREDIMLAEIIQHTNGLPPLDGSKRCDRCDAQAYVRTLTKSLNKDLWFCAHHYHEHEITLVTTMRIIQDYRQLLVENRLIGAIH